MILTSKIELSDELKSNLNQTVMKKFHPFFSIGTLGMIVIALLHVFLALGLELSSTHGAFFTIYPVFLTFIILGVTFTIKDQKNTAKS